MSFSRTPSVTMKLRMECCGKLRGRLVDYCEFLQIFIVCVECNILSTTTSFFIRLLGYISETVWLHMGDKLKLFLFGECSGLLKEQLM